MVIRKSFCKYHEQKKENLNIYQTRDNSNWNFRKICRMQEQFKIRKNTLSGLKIFL